MVIRLLAALDETIRLPGKQRAEVALRRPDSSRRFLLAKGGRFPDPLNHRVIPHLEALAWSGMALCVAVLRLKRFV